MLSKIHSHVAPEKADLDENEENRLDLIRQRNNRKMTLQPPNPLEEKEAAKEDVSEIKKQFLAARKNTMSAFVPIKDNVSKKSMDEASMFLKNSCLKPDQAMSNGEV